jgi:hypothetical protein
MKLFFIVGTGRCGTQMVRNILKTWADIKILPETHFILPLYNRYGTKDITFEQFIEVVDNIYSQDGQKFIHGILADAKNGYDSYKSAFQSFVIEKKLRGNVRAFTEAFFEFLYGESFIFGDKTPHYGIHAGIIKKLWPEAKFIHICRDGVDVAHSMLGHGGFIKLISRNIAPGDIDEYMYGKEMAMAAERRISIEESLPYWEIAILETEKALLPFQENSDYIKVKYEDIVFKPKSEVTKLAKFLEVDNDNKALKRAITIPRPFPEKHSVKKLKDDEYARYFYTIKKTMDHFDYPYNVNVDRDFFETFQELYRGRFYYLLSLKKNIKKFIKILVGKA